MNLYYNSLSLQCIFSPRCGFSIIAKVIAMLLLMTTISCKHNQKPTPKIMDKITALQEFKAEEKRIDSLKQTGMAVDITISIIKGSLDANETNNDISTAFINEDLGFDQKILYEIKFNSKTEDIISIKNTKPEAQ
jgi:hypothetical protein